MPWMFSVILKMPSLSYARQFGEEKGIEPVIYFLASWGHTFCDSVWLEATLEIRWVNQHSGSVSTLAFLACEFQVGEWSQQHLNMYSFVIRFLSSTWVPTVITSVWIATHVCLLIYSSFGASFLKNNKILWYSKNSSLQLFNSQFSSNM